MFYLVFGLFFVVFFSPIAVCRFANVSGDSKKKIEKWMRIGSVVLVCLSFADLFLPDAFTLRFIWDFAYLKENHDPFHAVVRALNAIAVITIPIAVFYRKPAFLKVTAYVMLPSVLLSLVCYPVYLSYFTSDLTHHATVFGEKLWPFLTNPLFRSIVFGVIMELELILSLYVVLYSRKDDLFFKTAKSFGGFVILTFALIASILPISTIQQITGFTTDITFNIGDPTHFAYIAALILEAVVLTLVFRKRSDEDKYILLLIMSISLLFQFNSFFKTDGIITATRYPLQLCNIAAAFLIVTMLTRSEKMFHFTVVANVTGALIAIVICDSTKDIGVLYCMNIHYMTEHANVLLVPILALILGVFKPLKTRDYKHFAIGFTAYYVFVWLLGTVLNGLAVKTGNSYFTCNFFYMFGRDDAVRLIGEFAGKLFDYKLTYGQYYNVYLAQIVVYFVFMAGCSLIFLILRLLFGKDRIHETKQSD